MGPGDLGPTASQATAGDYRVAVYGTRGLAETERNLEGFRFTPAPDKPGHAPSTPATSGPQNEVLLGLMVLSEGGGG